MNKLSWTLVGILELLVYKEQAQKKNSPPETLEVSDTSLYSPQGLLGHLDINWSENAERINIVNFRNITV